MSDAHPFESARKFEHELSARQREILGMLAAGRTNAEIASAFDMTPDGAKWHVGEIYSKLGLASREEAAAYWHWRTGFHGRRAAFARVFAPAASWRFAAGGGLLAGVVLAAFLFLRDDGDEPFELGPYTASVAYSTGGVAGMREEIRFADNRHWSMEFRRPGQALGGYTYADGAVLTTYLDGRGAIASDFIEHMYSERPIPAPFGSRSQAPLISSDALLAGRVVAPGIDQTLRVLRDERGLSMSEVRRLENQSILGRETAVIDVTPAKGPANRIWVDLESGVVLRLEETRDEVVFVHEVVALDTNPGFDGSNFTYAMPPGTTPPTPSEGQLRAGPPGSRIGLPGFSLAPAADDASHRFELKSVVVALDDSGRINSEYSIPGMPGVSVSVEQSPSATFQPADVPGFAMKYPGIENSISEEGEDRIFARLWTNATMVEVASNGVGRDELVDWLSTFAIVEPEY